MDVTHHPDWIPSPFADGSLIDVLIAPDRFGNLQVQPCLWQVALISRDLGVAPNAV